MAATAAIAFMETLRDRPSIDLPAMEPIRGGTITVLDRARRVAKLRAELIAAEAPLVENLDTLRRIAEEIVSAAQVGADISTDVEAAIEQAEDLETRLAADLKATSRRGDQVMAMARRLSPELAADYAPLLDQWRIASRAYLAGLRDVRIRLMEAEVIMDTRAGDVRRLDSRDDIRRVHRRPGVG